ncbi:MAG TPA: BTAD domain-containing putative transcriptional regulator [Caulobacteraceae bacterium]|jgi:DNA-binding SARP family transcriptional activator/tetratricopeptide (TPR) repeat protein
MRGKGAEAEPERATERAPYQARLFGEFILTAPDGTDVTPAGRKARALLAYLLVTGTPVSRERLTGLLWGDRGEEQARASLRQTFYELRALVAGEAPLLAVERTQARVIAGRVETDLGCLQALAGSNDAKAAVALLAPGDILSRLDDIDSDFDQWLAEERSRRREERRAIGLGIVGRALAGGAAAAAAALADRLLETEPSDEAVARAAMEAHARAGDVKALRATYDRHAQAVRRDLDMAPDPGMAALLDRLSSTVSGVPHPRRRSEWALAPAGPALSDACRQRPPRLLAGGVALATALVACGLLAGLLPEPQDGGTAPAARILLVQTLNTPPGDGPARALAIGVSDDLARMMVGIDPRLRVINTGDRSTGHVEYLAAGDARSGGGRIYAGLRLISADSGAILWSRSFERDAAEPDALREQMVAHLADVATCGLGGRNPDLATLGVEVMRLYLQACEEKHEDWQHGAKLLAQVVQQRPRFAHAWAMLAAATAATASLLPPDVSPEPTFRLAEGYARRALTIDPDDGEAYEALSQTRQGLANWSQRYAFLSKGLAVEPGNEVLTIDLAEDLMTVGRRREGLYYARRAMDLDPFNQWAVMDLILDYGFSGQPDDVDSLIALAQRRWPRNPDVVEAYFDYLARVGDPAHAERMLDDPKRPFYMPPDRLRIWRALIRARETGNPAPAVRAIETDIPSASPPQLLGDSDDLVVLGRPDIALEVLDRTGTRPDVAARMFQPYWAPVRADPRFMRFAARQGLVAIWRKTGRWPDFCSEPGHPYDCAMEAGRVGG